MENKQHKVHLPILKEIGLSESEALIYEVLLEEGPSSGAKVATVSGLGRGNAYNVLASLKGKGLVTEEGKVKTIFRAADPENLRTIVEIRRQTAERMAAQLEAVLPGLKSSHRLFTKQPTVRVFEGVEGLKEIYKETIREGKVIHALVSPDEPVPEIYRWLTTQYVKSRVAAGIEVKVIANGESQAAEYIAKSRQELREARFVKGDKYPFRGEIDIFGDKVAFIAYKKDELIGVIIESPSVAETLRSVVELLFATLPTPSV